MINDYSFIMIYTVYEEINTMSSHLLFLQYAISS
jgi:hypothetical protein